jgi:hypothetical protein
MDGRRVTLTLGTTLRFGSLGFVYTEPVEPVARRTFARPPRPNVLTGAAGCEAFVRGFSDDVIVGMLGPNPTQEHFSLATYYLTDLAFQANGDGPLGWGEFMERHTAMYPRGQSGLPDDPVTTYVNGVHTIGAAPGSTTTQRARTARRHDPMRECKVCVATASSSSESEPAPRHRGADDQRRAWLDELAKARRQLDEELALLHRELGVEAKPRKRQPVQEVLVQGQAHDENGNRRPTQDVPMQGEPREENGDRRERRPAAGQPRGRAPAPPARVPELDNDRRINGGVNVNPDADAPPLFRWASQNLAAADMLLRRCPEPATSEER